MNCLMTPSHLKKKKSKVSESKIDICLSLYRGRTDLMFVDVVDFATSLCTHFVHLGGVTG